MVECSHQPNQPPNTRNTKMKKEIGQFMEYPDFEDALVRTIRQKRNTKRVSIFDYWHDGDGAADTTAVEMRINGHTKVYGLNEVAEILGYDRMRFGEDGVQLFKTVEVPKAVVLTDEEIRARYKPEPETPEEPQKPEPPKMPREYVQVDYSVWRDGNLRTKTVVVDTEPLHDFLRGLKRAFLS